MLCYVVAFITFYFFQTTVPRPIVTGDDIFSKLILFTYKSDLPYNCFPSIHVITAFLALKGLILLMLRKRIKIPVNVVGFLIIISTQFVKQHVIMDIFYAIFLCNFFFNFITYMEERHYSYNSKKVFNFLEKDIEQYK